MKKTRHAKRRREVERVLHVFLSCVRHVLNLMACFLIRRHMRPHSNLHTKRDPLFWNCHKAVLSIAHHSREAQMALILSASHFNWGITGKYVDHFHNSPWIHMRNRSTAAILFCFVFCRYTENKACKMVVQRQLSTKTISLLSLTAAKCC